MSENDNNNTEKNNQPLIITAMIVGAVLVIALAWIFSRNDTSTLEPDAEQERRDRNEQRVFLIRFVELLEEGEEIIASLQASTQRLMSAAEACDVAAFDAERPIIEDLATRSQQLSDEIEKMESAPPELLALPEAIRQETLKELEAYGGRVPCAIRQLEDNWNQLTAQEKNQLNPFDCDHETQWVSAENGTCIDREVPEEGENKPGGVSFLRFNSFITYSPNFSEPYIACRFYYVPQAIEPSDADFAWSECGLTLRFEATADLDRLTDILGQSYLYRTGMTDDSGNQCLALERDFLQFTFGEGEHAVTETYDAVLSGGIHPSNRCQLSAVGGLEFTEIKKGEFYDIGFYIEGRTTAELRRKVAITIKTNPEVILNDVGVKFAGGQSPVE